MNFREFRRFFERNFPLDLLNLRLESHDAECLVLTNCYACNYIFCTRIFCHCDWIKSDSQAYCAISWKISIHQNFNHVSLIDHDHTDEHATQPISCDNFSFVQRHCHRHFSKENTTKQQKDASDFSACIRFFLIRLVIFGKKKFICCDQQKLCHSGFSFLTHLPVDQKISSHLILVDCMSFVDLFMF